MKAKGLVSSKDEFYYQMDLQDIEDAGAFIEKHVWDNYILERKKGVTVAPRDYTK